MKKLLSFIVLLILIFTLSACKPDGLGDYTHEVEEITWQSIEGNRIRVYDMINRAPHLVREMELQHVPADPALEIMMFDHVEKYNIGPADNYGEVRLIVNMDPDNHSLFEEGEEVDIMQALSDGIIKFADIERLDLPVVVLHEYEYDLFKYDIIGRRGIQYHEGDVVRGFQMQEGDVVTYTLEARSEYWFWPPNTYIAEYDGETYVYEQDQIHYLLRIMFGVHGDVSDQQVYEMELYTAADILAEISNGNIDGDFLINLGYPLYKETTAFEETE